MPFREKGGYKGCALSYFYSLLEDFLQLFRNFRTSTMGLQFSPSPFPLGFSSGSWCLPRRTLGVVIWISPNLLGGRILCLFVIAHFIAKMVIELLRFSARPMSIKSPPMIPPISRGVAAQLLHWRLAGSLLGLYLPVFWIYCFGSTVHVDNVHGLGMFDNQVGTFGARNGFAKRCFDLPFDPKFSNMGTFGIIKLYNILLLGAISCT